MRLRVSTLCSWVKNPLSYGRSEQTRYEQREVSYSALGIYELSHT
jgi:hypothetical protein